MISKMGITSYMSGVLLCEICCVAMSKTYKHTSEIETPRVDRNPYL
jgi:hypothetical protein